METFVLFLIFYYVFSLFFCYGVFEDDAPSTFWGSLLDIIIQMLFCWLFMPLIIGKHFKNDF